MSGGLPFVGLVPAGGRGRRLGELRYPKELLPMVYECDQASGARPRAVAEYAVEAIRAADAHRILFVVAPWKMDVVSYVGDGSALGIQAGYLYQEHARGLANALDTAHEWCRHGHTVFAMPDTIFRPADALARLRTRYLAERADLALAVFPTAEPHRLGPVESADGTVLRVHDKPEHPPVANTWGAAIWGPRFSDFLHDRLAAGPELPAGQEAILGDIYQEAVDVGMRVVAEVFPEGAYYDTGTELGILRTLMVAAGPTPGRRAG